MSRRVLEDVGLNEEQLFIDFVDSEWCWRAVAKGYRCCMTTNIVMTHHIGRRIITIGPIKDIISSPQRYFYQYRNYLWMLRRPYVPRQWKISVGVKSILRLFYFPFFIKDGWKSWKYMWKGIWKGLSAPK